MTLIELLLVATIIALTAGLALPNIADTTRSYRAKEGATQTLAAIRAARTTSQKRNEPVRLRQAGAKLILETPTYLVGGVPTTDVPSGLVKAIDNSQWVEFRSIRIPDVVFSFFPAEGLTFCPTEEARYRLGSLNGTPVCGLGDLVNQSTQIEFEAFGARYTIDVNRAIGNARMQRRE